MHNAGMTVSITIRDVPNKTRDELASRAAAGGRSLQEYLRAKLVEFAGRPDLDTFLERLAEQKSAMGTSLSAEEILEAIHADRR